MFLLALYFLWIIITVEFLKWENVLASRLAALIKVLNQPSHRALNKVRYHSCQTYLSHDFTDFW